jgi:hypothetical protein
VRLRWLSAVISNEKNSDGNGSVQSTPRRESFSVQPNTTLLSFEMIISQKSKNGRAHSDSR